MKLAHHVLKAVFSSSAAAAPAVQPTVSPAVAKVHAKAAHHGTEQLVKHVITGPIAKDMAGDIGIDLAVHYIKKAHKIRTGKELTATTSDMEIQLSAQYAHDHPEEIRKAV